MKTIDDEWFDDYQEISLADFRVPILHHLALLLGTLLVSATGLLYSLMPNLKTGFQWQETYTAWATLQGQLPYLDTFSRAGFLYHSLSALSRYLGGSYLYLGVQALCLYVAGLYLHKLVNLLTEHESLGLKVASTFYLLNLVLGVGGFYPMQLASPFVVLGLWFLATYSLDLRSDEVFIAYGLVAALAIGFEPRTLGFWLLSLLTLLIIQLGQGLKARGIYQLLALILGVILIAYPAGYLVLNLQLLLPYLEQTLWTNLPSWYDPNLLAIGLRGFLLVASGLLTGLVALPLFFGKMAEQKALLVLISLSTLGYSIWALLSPAHHPYDLLLVLPFGLVLTALAFTPVEPEEEVDDFGELTRTNRRFRRFSSGPKRAFFLVNALLVILVGLGYPFYSFANRQNHIVQSQQVASYLKDKVVPGQHIYVWDDRAHVYLDSQTLSATSFPLATVNTQGDDQAKLLSDQLLQERATYVLVNKSLPLPEAVQKKLTSKYKPVTLEGIDLYTLYELE